MDPSPVLPAALATACNEGHPLELWVLVDGEIVQCPGLFMQPAAGGRPQLSATLPSDFVGVIRSGSAVRGFFADHHGAIHTFLTSVHRWVPYDDNPRSARILLDAPVIVAPCQRRRSRRRTAQGLTARLAVTIRNQRESVSGRLVDASSHGVGLRLVRTASNWFAKGTHVEVEVDLPDTPEPVVLECVVARVGTEALHYLYGLRLKDAQAGRAALRSVLDHLI